MKQRGRKNEGQNNKEETEDEHGNKCKVKKPQQHRTKMQAGTYPVLSSIRHVSCILHEGARDCSAFSILDRDEVELILCIVCIVHENLFWDCWRSCKSSKKVERQKFKRHGRATKRGTL